MSASRGSSAIEALIAAAIGLLVLCAVSAALAGGARALVRGGARAEASDTAALATEAFLFDVRRAGHDPAAVNVTAVTLARTDRMVIESDLDGSGGVDPSSAERVTWICNASTQKLSRVLGAQSLPLADGAVGCAFSYLDGTGTALVPPSTGLDASDRARIALVILDLRLRPRGGGGHVARSLAVALRGRS
jgi:Tfp pilus assembly protein PilW